MEAVMRIRDLKWRGIPAWPPEWWISDEGAGEEGVLENVQLRNYLIPSCVLIKASHLGYDRTGIIVLEDSAHLKILSNKLKENIGKPLTEIGDLEIDFGFFLPRKGQKRVRPRTTPEKVILTKKSYTKAT
jgi:hypothetical protein